MRRLRGYTTLLDLRERGSSAMADFVDWFEGTGGDAVGDDDTDLLQELVDAAGSTNPQRDAVLFLVDCGASMFKPLLEERARAVNDPVDLAVKLEEGNNRESVSGETPRAVSSPFSRAIQCALAFYQEKVITSERDVVGLVLYQTAQRLNLYDFNGVYVFHEFDTPSAARVQELQVLAKAGQCDITTPNHVRKEFEQHIGHAAPQAMRLSEALWAAQHMFHSLRSPSIAYRRIFLFTDRDDPCSGIALERERCGARMKDLHDAGVALEVFAHGTEGVSAAVSCSTSNPSPASGSGSGTPQSTSSVSTPAPSSGMTFLAGSSSAPNGPLPMHATVTAAIGGVGVLPPASLFVSNKFWDALLAAPMNDGAVRSSVNGIMSLGTGSMGSQPSGGLGKASVSEDDYCGSVHISTALSTFDQLLSDVKLKAHPQRSTATYELRIASNHHSLSADAAGVPMTLVKMYIPVLRCPKPKFRWLDGATNTPISSETRYLNAATGAPMQPEDMLYATQVGGETVVFTHEESKQIRSACSGAVGLTILGFKPTSDALKHKYSVSRCAFIHAAARECGGASAHRFFVQLHRTLTTKAKVAIAELVARAGSSPRLVVLHPSAVGDHGNTIGPVTGLGFHVIPLPYADDLRSLEFPPMAAEQRPTSDQLNKARRLVRKLSVEYDPMAISNPALQRQYRILQRMALMETDDTLAAANDDDLTLPDADGMKKLAPVFRDFITATLPEHYNADSICPLPKPKKIITAADLAAIDFDDLEKRSALDSLTIPVLQQFLKNVKEDANGAKLKHELVKRVGEVVRKRRTVKREREE